MPLEGHWARQQTPLGARARAGIGLGAAAMVAVTATLAIASPGGTARVPGCVDATIASTTGGAAIHACGERARALCAAPGGSAEVRSACREAGMADAVR
jgi:hypothetical protein